MGMHGSHPAGEPPATPRPPLKWIAAAHRGPWHSFRKGGLPMCRTSIRALGLIVACAAASAIATPLHAGTTGKLTGKVVNEKKEPLAGVNIRIEGQRLGALTDDQGN